MLAENLLKNIGFSQEYIDTYDAFKEKVGDKTEPIAKSYTQGEISLGKALECIHRFETETLCTYTLDLIFLLDCTSYLLEKFRKNGFSDKVFYNTMQDIKYKVDECMNVKVVFGTFVINWYDRFFNSDFIGLGRLQYDITTHKKDSLKVGKYTINDGDFILSCHIPSSGPLTHELCINSYRLAYDLFRDRLSSGILPVHCSSWLLYPPYQAVFGENSNTARFAGGFEVYNVIYSDTFDDSWRIFNTEYSGDLSQLPSETYMQRSFIEYIKNGGTFGTGDGYLLFDGENIITHKIFSI